MNKGSYFPNKSISIEEYKKYLSLTNPQKNKRKSPEEDLHRQCIEWVSLMEKSNPILISMTHVPNGGKRPNGEAGKLKAMGVKPGFPDLFLPKKNLNWQGLAIELKSPVGVMSTAQSN